MENYEVIFESENLDYIKMSNTLVDEYFNHDIQKKLFRKTFTPEQILNWIQKQLLNKDDYIFSIIEKFSNRYIGNAEVIIKDNIGEIVISITPKEQNKHFGTEALKAIVNYGYDTIELEGFELYVYKNNPKAIHCYENIGFLIEGKGISEDDIHMKHQR